jgi:hypothetical protein
MKDLTKQAQREFLDRYDCECGCGRIADSLCWTGEDGFYMAGCSHCDETWEVYFGVNPRKDELMETE